MNNFSKTLTKICCFFAMFNVSNILSQVPTYQWAYSYGNTLADEGKALATDGSGNVFAVGEFRNTVDFDPGPATIALTSAGVTDVYITKIDINGSVLWAKQVGNITADYVKDITVDASGNLLITGAFQGSVDFDPNAGFSMLTSSGSYDVYVLKLDNNGNFLWARNMGGSSSDQGMSIATTATGEVMTIGEFNGTADFDPSALTSNLSSAGGVDIFVSKLDASGNFVWADRFGGTGTESGLSIATNSLGVFFTGYFQGTADFDPSVATFNLNSNGSNDVFVCRLNSTGTLSFAINVGGTGADIANSITLDAGTSILITGQFNGTADFDPSLATNSLTSSGSSDVFVAKYTNNGSLTWVRKFGGSFADYGYSVKSDNSNNIYTTGTFKDIADFDPSVATFTAASNSNTDDIYIHKLDANGNFTWVKYFGGNNADLSNNIAVYNNNTIYTTGNYQSTVDFNPDAGVNNISSIGNSDAFIHKMSTCIAPNSPTNTTQNSNLTICNGQSASLSVSGTGTLTWYPTANSTTSLALGNNYLTPTLSAGTYSYYVEASTCTISVSRTQITVTVSACTNIMEEGIAFSNVKIYPNPSSGVYKLNGLVDNTMVIVNDIFGREIFKETISVEENEIDISKYANGVYFLTLKVNNNVSIHRVVKL